MNSIEMWRAAERFYNVTIPGIFLGLSLWAIVVIFVLSYTARKSKGRNKFFIGSGLTILIFGFYSGWAHTRYSDYFLQYEFINPGIRSYSLILGFKNPEEQALIDLYQEQLTQLDQYQALDMYEEQEEQAAFPYEYLGLFDRDHYFTFRDDEERIFRFTGDVEPTEGESYIYGYHFYLVDDQFKEYGFMDTPYPLIETIYINEEEFEQSQGAEISLPYTLIHISFIIDDWNLGNQRIGGTNLEY